jgi:DNA gyrase subunit A
MSPVQERVIDIGIEEEMRTSYLNYAMSVIVSRALPDVRDGLKPVHRRILYGMHSMGLRPSGGTRKSAKIVGEVMGNYHPHGDSAIYDTLVRMGQPFNLRYPLVDGQGNYGSIDGDPAAAMRYTEAKLSRIAEEMLADIEKDTVDFGPNYDETHMEPSVLPTRLPNLLVNGASGIAVGYATNIPTHNLSEVIAALLLLLDQPDADLKALLKLLPGPDFPTGGMIVGRQGIKEAYATGKGSVTIRAKVITEDERGRSRLIVTEIPYQVNKAKLIEKIAELVNEKRLNGIADVRDESDRDGIRIVLELKRGETSETILRSLYQYTPLETTFGINLLALVENRPTVLTLKHMLEIFLSHRREVVLRRSAYELRKAEHRAHILEGFHLALGALDRVIALIRRSPSPQAASTELQRQLRLTEVQATAILDLKLQRLTALERAAIERERSEIARKIRELQGLIADPKKVDRAVKEELQAVQTEYGDGRRTKLLRSDQFEEEVDQEPLGPMMTLMTQRGYLSRIPLETWTGGQRRKPVRPKGDRKRMDPIIQVVRVDGGQRIAGVTSKGRLFGIDLDRIPVHESQERGIHLSQLYTIEDGETLLGIVPQPDGPIGGLIVATAKGLAKHIPWEAIGSLQRRPVTLISPDETDRVVGILTSNQAKTVALYTQDGHVVLFSIERLAPTNRETKAMSAMTVARNDQVIGLAGTAERRWEMLTVTQRGYAKRTSAQEYHAETPGGKGMAALRQTERTGSLCTLFFTSGTQEFLLATNRGRTLWLQAGQVGQKPRTSTGERLQGLEGADEVILGASTVESSIGDRN